MSHSLTQTKAIQSTYSKDERIPITQRGLQMMKPGETILFDGESCTLVSISPIAILRDGEIEIDVPLSDLSEPDYELIEARLKADHIADLADTAAMDRAYAECHERVR